MRGYVKYIGIVDKDESLHYLEFAEGVNIITGKSSSGKSAIISIFDYCFGGSESAIPYGVITERADIYFLVLKIKDNYLITARKPADNRAFLKNTSESIDIKSINAKFFDNKYFMSLNDFKDNLGKYFGLNIDDTDEGLMSKDIRGRKKEKPSIRNIVSFLLQQQNLIANNHSLFYRFDEKEKREQTIEQFKIFAGFVNQDYFIIKQKLSEAQRELKVLQGKQPQIAEQNSKNTDAIERLLKEYFILTNHHLLQDSAVDILKDPANTLDRLNNVSIIVDYESNTSIEELNGLESEINKLYADKRLLQSRLKDINSSTTNTKEYFNTIQELSNYNAVSIKISKCPFCHTYNDNIYKESNELIDAIEWLNTELAKSTYLISSFISDKKDIEDSINKIDIEIKSRKSRVKSIKDISLNLARNRSLQEQALKIKLKLEATLENILNQITFDIDKQIQDIKNRISELEKILLTNFNVEKNMREATQFIEKTMNEIGSKFDFEESYKPINLKFSLENFELWHERNHNKVYLRSMGSGANWLYSHITLFLSMHKYFCSLGDKSIVPPILFLDQPSQVYFPAKDIDTDFDAKKVGNGEKKDSVDEDLRAVTNLFDQLVDFCKNTYEQTGINPQIIIMEHADKLILSNANFEDLVNGRRWRNKGFIN
ncbi:DUF3732 domain-containing protein [Campylobacter mucosalis]|uniref:DUF3732 domain-containing protein n=1 Tax=Campylobacter mucosalis TaxID=202 RepID=UPI0006923681|nr:DUF3732 domain-containing protein [Campylobacter mucosalis]QKF62442.1 DUF3732 domain-containing protein [Campylobacter mucosalis]